MAGRQEVWIYETKKFMWCIFVELVYKIDFVSEAVSLGHGAVASATICVLATNDIFLALAF